MKKQAINSIGSENQLSKIADEVVAIRTELEKGKKAGKMEESWFEKIEQRVSIVEKQLKSQKSLVIK